MPCIRRRYNYGNVWMTPTVIENQAALCGQTVDVLLADGFKRVHFAGFIKAANVELDMQRIKLIHIEAFNPVESILGDWKDYGPNAVMLGAYRNHSAYLVLDDGLPVAWCELRKPAAPVKNNVVSLANKKAG